jgi:uncharacterized protein (DUF305 family)
MTRHRRLWLAVAIAAAAIGGAAAQQREPVQPMAIGQMTMHSSPPDRFPALMDDTMARMDAAMAVGYTGNADDDFARMMIAHHQGAIDMAELELRFGTDERLRRLAQEIIVTQGQEIMVMRGALGNAALPQAPTRHASDSKGNVQ